MKEIKVKDCNDCLFQAIEDRGYCSHPDMKEENQWLGYKNEDKVSESGNWICNKVLIQPNSCPLKKESVKIELID